MHISMQKPYYNIGYTRTIDHDSRNKSRRNKQASCVREKRENVGALNNLTDFFSSFLVRMAHHIYIHTCKDSPVLWKIMNTYYLLRPSPNYAYLLATFLLHLIPPMLSLQPLPWGLLYSSQTLVTVAKRHILTLCSSLFASYIYIYNFILHTFF